MRQEPPEDGLVLRREHKCVPRYCRCRPPSAPLHLCVTPLVLEVPGLDDLAHRSVPDVGGHFSNLFGEVGEGVPQMLRRERREADVLPDGVRDC